MCKPWGVYAINSLTPEQNVRHFCRRHSLRWRHNEHDSVSNHQHRDCLLNHLFRHRFQSSASLAFVRGIHRWPVNSPHKGPVTRKMIPFDDVLMSVSWFKFQWSLFLLVQLRTCMARASAETTCDYLCLSLYMWVVITCACPWYLSLAHTYSINNESIFK